MDVQIEGVDEDCSGIRREEWTNIPLLLVNDDGNEMAKGICRNWNPVDCVDDKPLGESDIGVLIMEPAEGMMDMGAMFSLRRWPISRAYHDGFSLLQHQQVSTFRLRDHTRLLAKRRIEGKNTYDTTKKPTERLRPPKKTQVLAPDAIRQLSTIECCDGECLRYFPREEVLALRTEFYGCSTRMRHSKSIHVHGQVHQLPGGSKWVTLCGRNVCLRAWHEIFAVSKSSFYRNRSEFMGGLRARDHGNLNMKRNRVATLQATATLKELLQDKADMMPHKSRTLPNGEKVVEMVLPRGTKWNSFLGTINQVRIVVVCVEHVSI